MKMNNLRTDLDEAFENFLEASAPSDVPEFYQHLMKFLDSFFTSSKLYENLKSFESCKTDYYKLSTSLVDFANYCASDNFSKWTALIKAKDIGMAIFDTYRNCNFKEQSKDFQALIAKIAAAFEQKDYLSKIVDNAKSNFIELAADVQKILKYQKDGDFENMGKTSGELLKKIFLY